MNLLKNFFSKRDKTTASSNTDFWNWFQKNEQDFFQVIKEHANIERDFINIVSPMLQDVHPGYFVVTGMRDDNTAELIITPDGVVKNVVFAEELISDAPQLDNWKFTALKPEHNIDDVAIKMNGYLFNKDNLSFYSKSTPDYPDEIEIVVVHEDLTEENQREILQGSYIFLEHYLGELNFIEKIDDFEFEEKKLVENELIPIEKLKDYINRRQNEFIEKYEGTKNVSDSDSFSLIEGIDKSGKPLIASVNNELLNWDGKASHPWILRIDINYDGDEKSGLPDSQSYEQLNLLEEQLNEQLPDVNGYLNIGRVSASNERNVYFACKDYRLPSKVVYALKQRQPRPDDINYEIYKDKYWRSLDFLIPQ